MKTLILTRHAKSDWNSPWQQDYDRTLNERGRRDAPEMGRRLMSRSLYPDLILSSTAQRASETAMLIAGSINHPFENIKWLQKLYHASPEILLEAVCEVDNQINTLLLVAHNNGITEFANQQCGLITDNMPTCAMIAFEADCPGWQQWGTSKRRFLFYDFPKLNMP